MSHTLISRSSDLARLQAEGYEIEVRSKFLFLKNVPYVTQNGEIRYGTLISPLELAVETTSQPSDHTVWFEGYIPCDQTGASLAQHLEPGGAATAGERRALGPGVNANYQFSRKPPSGRYADYYEKMTTYEESISRHAQALDPTVTARTFEVTFTQDDDDSPFKYADTASSRAQIGIVNQKLELDSVAIVGLGGTGSYILDLVAKAPVKEIHLFDGDRFAQHNAFRTSGAASVEVLRASPRKAGYLKDVYSAMRRGIHAHPGIDESNVESLSGMGFVFLAMGANPSRDLTVTKLKEFGVPFVDAGMGIFKESEKLGGIVRTSFNKSVPSTPGADGGVYASNIQVADLNALNAALAVIRWKKTLGFYADLAPITESAYQVETGRLVNTS